MYYNKCCVPGCKSLRQDVFLHKLPKCEKGLKKWLDRIGSRSLNIMRSTDLGKQFVCHQHFEARFKSEKNRLKRNAYPSLFSPEEISSGLPTSHISENVNPHLDHNYAKKMSRIEHSYAKPAIDNSLKQWHRDVIPSTSRITLADIKNTSLEVIPAYENMLIQQQGSINIDVQDTQPGIYNKTGTPKRQLKYTNKKKFTKKNISLLPNVKKLYMEYRKSRKLISFHSRSKKAMKYAGQKVFEKMTNNMNALAKQIFWMQIKLCTREKKGRRFSLEEKLLSLSIMKQSPKAYKFLQKIFILPSATTLKGLTKKLHIAPGINPQILNCIQNEVQNWSNQKKYCSVIFDEVSLEPGLTYDVHNDIINGFVHLTDRSPELADHALVFIVKGALFKWQQVIAFYFCKGATNGIELKQILIKIIQAVGDTGLIPIAIISDQGTAFQSALKNLQQATRREQILLELDTDNTIHINNYSLNVIYDPPHLIKGVRNNFLNKNIVFDGKVSKWQDIIDVYNADCQNSHVRLLHKLDDEHVIPEKIKKMKVKNCVRVLSNTMASALSYTSAFAQYIDGRPVSDTLKNTAEIVLFFDQLFDSINGVSTYNKKTKGKTLRTAVTEKSNHLQFWTEATEKLKRIKFLNSNGREIVVPSLKNWITTIKSMERLWIFFVQQDVSVMRPRYFNSDVIENFFGQVRAYNYRSNNPDCHSFSNTFKSLLITSFLKFHNTTYNCEDDSNKDIISIKSLFNEVHNNEVNTNSIIQERSLEEPFYCDNLIEEARRERLHMHSRAYTAGWVVRKVIRSVNNCASCIENFTVVEKTNLHMWVSQREYKDMKDRKLAYASESAIILFGEIIKYTNAHLQTNAHRSGISEEMQKILVSKLNLNFISCEIHRNVTINAFLKITVKLCLYNWCNSLNKILRGTDIKRLSKNLTTMQKKAYEMYKKRFKK